MKNWNSLFNSERQRKGGILFRLGLVSSVHEVSDGYEVTVRDERDMHVKITVKNGVAEQMSCGCADAVKGVHCQHMAAAIMAIEAEGHKLRAPGEEIPQEKSHSRKNSGSDSSGPSADTENASGAGNTEDSQLPVKSAQDADDLFSTDPESEQRMNALPDLEKIRREDLAGRISADPEEEEQLESLENYRYFQYTDYMKGLGITPKILKQARKLIADGECSALSVATGFLSPAAVAGRYGQEESEELSGKALVGSASVIIGGNVKAELLFGRRKLLRASCNDWNCYRVHMRGSSSYLGEGICAHEAAAILLLQEFLEKNNIGDDTDEAGLKFLRSMSAISGDRVMPEGAQLSGQAHALTIIPYVSVDDEGQMSAQFRISAGKAYKIRNLEEFLEDMAQGTEKIFGKSTVIRLGEEYLDQKGERWLEFIRETIESEQQRADRLNSGAQDYYGYYRGYARTYDYEISDSIPLYGAAIDRFYELCGQEAVEFQISDEWNGRKQKTMLTAVEEPLRPVLTLKSVTEKGSGELAGVALSGHVPDMVYGRDGAYFVRPPHLVHVSTEQIRQLEPLLRSARNGEVSMRIGRRRMQEFYRNMLPALRTMAQVKEEDTAAMNRYLPPAAVLVCYLDVEEGNVIAHPEAIYGTRVHEVTDLIGSSSQAQIRELMPEKAPQKLAPYRDLKRENALLELLAQYLNGYDDRLKVLFTRREDERVFAFLDSGLDRLLKICEVHTTDRFRRLGIHHTVSLRVGVSIENGLMDLSVTGSDLTQEELLDLLYHYRLKQKFVRLRNGDFLKIDQNDAVAQLSEILDTLRITPKEFVKGKMHLPAYRALYVDRMLEQVQGASVDRDRHFKELIKGFKTVDDSDFEIPAGLTGRLRGYQEAGYRWLRTLDTFGFGGILADEMGLGKTLQVIAVLLAVKEERPEGERANVREQRSSGTAVMEDGELVYEENGVPTRSIVVCPASLVYNWEAEFHRFAPQLNVCTITGTSSARREKIAGSSGADVLVTSYDLLKRDIDAYEGILFRFAVIDEAQFIKNHTTAAARSVKLLRAVTRFALTGTPIENRLSELWSIFDFLMPGFLYEYSVFRNDYEQQIVKYEDTAVRERLGRMTAPFILRRLKKDVLRDLPEKLEEVRYAGMEGEQQKLYDAQVIRMRQKLASQSDEDFRTGKLMILSQLTRIRQICCDPALCYQDYHGGSAKREACMDLIRQAVEGEHRMLVFSQFVSMLNLLEEDLKAEGLEYYMITGETPKKRRLELVNAFNEGNVPVFLISLKAGGTGLNLTGADVVIHYDPWWNLAAQNQATDRAHRIGQTKIVTVYRLIMKGTIEEKILDLQEAKKQLADDILGAEGVSSSTISREDLLAMLE